MTDLDLICRSTSKEDAWELILATKKLDETSLICLSQPFESRSLVDVKSSLCSLDIRVF